MSDSRRWNLAAPIAVAAVLGVVTTGSRQWQMLTSNLPRRPDFSVFRFAPSGNEWHIQRWHGFGADSYALHRSYTCNQVIDAAADASAVLAGGGLPARAISEIGKSGTMARVVTWGWPLRHTSLDQFGSRRYRALGASVDSLLYAAAWWVILHVMRRPVAAVINHFHVPPYACRGCRYDLRGLPEDAPCPECGRARPTMPSSP